jgi:hypothetical protein
LKLQHFEKHWFIDSSFFSTLMTFRVIANTFLSLSKLILSFHYFVSHHEKFLFFRFWLDFSRCLSLSNDIWSSIFAFIRIFSLTSFHRSLQFLINALLWIQFVTSSYHHFQILDTIKLSSLFCWKASKSRRNVAYSINLFRRAALSTALMTLLAPESSFFR